MLSKLVALFFVLLFAGSGIGKFMNFEQFKASVYDYAIVPHGIITEVAALVAFLELLGALLLLFRGTRFLGALVAGGLLSVFTIAVIINLGRGREIECGCFLFGISVPRDGLLGLIAGIGNISLETVIRNIIFILLIVMVCTVHKREDDNFIAGSLENRFYLYPLFVIFFFVVAVKGVMPHEEGIQANIYDIVKKRASKSVNSDNASGDDPIASSTSVYSKVNWNLDFYYAVYTAQQQRKKIFLASFIDRKGTFC